jgi:hypothetical protein
MNRVGRQLKNIFGLLSEVTPIPRGHESWGSYWDSEQLADNARHGGSFYHGKTYGEGWDGGYLNPRQGLHVGTYRQAKEIVGLASADLDEPMLETPIYDVEVTPRKPYMPGGEVHEETGGGDSRQLLLGLTDKKLLEEGYDVIPYTNRIEEPGVLSYRVLDPSSVTVDPVAEWGRRDLSKVLRESPYRTYGREVTGRRLPTRKEEDWVDPWVDPYEGEDEDEDAEW